MATREVGSASEIRRLQAQMDSEVHSTTFASIRGRMVPATSATMTSGKISERITKIVEAGSSLQSTLSAAQMTNPSSGRLMGMRARRSVGVSARTHSPSAGRTYDDTEPGTLTSTSNGVNAMSRYSTTNTGASTSTAGGRCSTRSAVDGASKVRVM